MLSLLCWFFPILFYSATPFIPAHYSTTIHVVSTGHATLVSCGFYQLLLHSTITAMAMCHAGNSNWTPSGTHSSHVRWGKMSLWMRLPVYLNWVAMFKHIIDWLSLPDFLLDWLPSIYCLKLQRGLQHAEKGLWAFIMWMTLGRSHWRCQAPWRMIMHCASILLGPRWPCLYFVPILLAD